MIHSAVKVLPVALSVSLVASCLPSCYTLAYADDLTDGGATNVSAEKQKEIAGDPSGFELAPGGGESDAYAADGGAAAEGYGPDVETTEGAIEDTTSGYGEVDSFVGSDVSTFGNDFGGSGFAADGNEDSSQFGVSSSNGNSSGIEEDSASFGTKGALGYLEDIVYLLGEIADYYRQGGGGISPLADINSIYDQLVGFRSSVGSMLGMTEGSSSVSNRYTWSLNGYTWSTGKTGIAYLISWLVTLVSSANSSLSSINSNTSYLSSLYSLLSKQWGQGFGGTIVEYKDSPLYYLRWIYDSQWTAWGYNYDGTAVYFANSPAGWLRRIDTNVDAIFTRAGLIINALSDVKSSLSNIFERLASVVDYESRINVNAAYLVDFQKAGNTTLSSIFERLASVVDYESRINVNAAYLVDFQKAGNTTLSSIFERLASVVDYESRINENAAFSVDSLNETNKLLGLLTADVAGIRDRFVLQDSLSDLFDLLVGDMQVPQTQAAISRIQDVMSTRFPFCIPSVVNVVLFGSLLADPAPPVWTFDVGGSPLVVDFADYGAFAEVSSWTVRLLFTAALLLNTRRFVYGVGGGD